MLIWNSYLGNKILNLNLKTKIKRKQKIFLKQKPKQKNLLRIIKFKKNLVNSRKQKNPAGFYRKFKLLEKSKKNYLKKIFKRI